MNLHELTEELLRLSRQLDEAIGFLKHVSAQHAESENAYRMAKAKAYLNSDQKTVDGRKAEMDLATEAERTKAHVDDAMRVAALEAVRSRRTQLSALQTVANAVRAEAEIARYGTDPPA